jgi:hypothetical protein
MANIRTHRQSILDRISKTLKEQGVYFEVRSVCIGQYVFFRVLILDYMKNNFLKFFELCLMISIDSMLQELVERQASTHRFNQHIQSLLKEPPAIYLMRDFIR